MNALNWGKEKRIVVYGTGEWSKRFLHENKGLNIVGVIDRFHRIGYFEGYKIIVWNDLDEYTADAIIIASSEAFYEEIYNRIFPICLEKGLIIYSPFGQNLMRYFGTPRDNSIGISDFDFIKKEIIKYDLISFDVFDTLLIRDVTNPTDIFYIMEEELKKENINLTQFALKRQECELRAKGITFEDIYSEIQYEYGLSDDEKKSVMDLEVSTEIKVTRLREEVYSILELAADLNKEVILISDMYLSKEQIEMLLHKAGINYYSDLYVSSEYGSGKNAKLYEIAKQKYEGYKVLHIGDNEYLDGVCPRKVGFDSIVISSTRNNFIKSGYTNVLPAVRGINERIIVGGIISKYFSCKNDIRFMNVKDVAMIYCMPFAVLYLSKIIQMIKACGEYEGVIFPARDGYVLKKIYDEVAPKFGIQTKSFYIPSSRKLMVRIGISNSDDLEFSYKYAKLSKDPLTQIYGLPQINGEADRGYSVELLTRYSKEIIEKSCETKKKYTKCLSEMGIDFEKKYLLCELNGQGTTQHYLRRLFKKNLDTVYLVRWHNGDNMDSEAVFDFWEGDGKYSCLNKRFDILETFFSAPHPSVIDIAEDLNWIYAKDERNKKIIDLVEAMQKTVKDYAISYFKDYYVLNDIMHPEFAERILETYEFAKFDGDAGLLNYKRYFDDLSNKYAE